MVTCNGWRLRVGVGVSGVRGVVGVFGVFGVTALLVGGRELGVDKPEVRPGDFPAEVLVGLEVGLDLDLDLAAFESLEVDAFLETSNWEI